ncbi:MAG: AAA family ATPase [Patescibacteria group bacterium]|nr:AAA family ATPase [Patescibacteria group bacterium]
MPDKRLLVFIGKPGVGKTTLINKVFPDQKIIDVQPYVWSYKVNGRVPEEKTLIAYQDMYRHLEALNDALVILELGTNHAEFNTKELKKLSQQFEVRVYLCTASVETCRARIKIRARGDDMEAMERRLQRDFPDEHIKLLESMGMGYITLDMEKSIPKLQRLVLV